MGDVLWIEPVIRALAARHRKVTVVTKYNELFLNYPLPNVTFRSDLTRWEKALVKIDMVLGTRLFSVNLDGAHEKDPHRHFLNTFQMKAGVPIVREYPRLYLSEAEKQYDPGIDGPYVVLHLESFADMNYRKVYGVDWAAVAAWLREKGYTVIQLGKEPTPIEGVIHRQTTIREMMALLNKASFFIGLDSGPSHVATALGVPSILFFGAVNPNYRHFTDLMKGFIMQSPCIYAGCFHETDDPLSVVCRLVGKEGIPVCSIHSTESVETNIEKLIQKYG